MILSDGRVYELVDVRKHEHFEASHVQPEAPKERAVVEECIRPQEIEVAQTARICYQCG